jgi:hypothetical protein
MEKGANSDFGHDSGDRYKADHHSFWFLNIKKWKNHKKTSGTDLRARKVSVI